MGLSTLFKYSAAPAALLVAAVTGWQYQVRGTAAATPSRSARAEQPPRRLASSEPVVDAAAPERLDAPTTPVDGPRAASSSEPPGAVEIPGAYHAPRVRVDGSPRVYAMTRNVWVRPEPNHSRSWIGFLWFGSSVKLRSPEPVAGTGCKGPWYAVEPRGYVCVDDDRATLDPEHPVVQGLTPYSPNLASAWPHRYGESLDLRRYTTLPSERTQRAREWYYRRHEALLARARGGEVIDALLGVDLGLPPQGELALPSLPRTLQMGHDRLRARSTVAWSREQLHDGRAFLLASDLQWVPKDRVKAYPPVTFRGVHLGRDARLPIAFFRGEDRPSYRLLPTGELELTEHVFPRLSWVELSGRAEQRGSETYLETRAPGLFVRRGDAVLPEPSATTPWGTPLDAPSDDAAPRRGRQTWMEVSIMGGWLLAYEGLTPVFATLVAPGRGGAPHAGRDPVETASTPVGRFKITGKFATATMVASNELTHSEVPWAQNFSGPHALHGAYWHDAWGERKSGGCINVSPIDGRWLFYEFTEPRIPEGWHGVRWLPKLEPATTLLVRKN